MIDWISSSDEKSAKKVDSICSCVHVKNELGYSNYYQTGENNLTPSEVVKIIDNVRDYYHNCLGMNLGINENEPYFQLMEFSGYDYGGLTTKLAIELIDGLNLKEVMKDEKNRVLEKSRKNV